MISDGIKRSINKMKFTYINTTQKDRGKPIAIQIINAHCARRRYRQRARQRDRKILNLAESNTHRYIKPEEDFSGERAGHIGIQQDTESQDKQLQHGYHDARIMWILQIGNGSSLDPFLAPAVALTSSEKSLMHFWLTNGRRMIYGTSQTPRFCPVLHSARILFETSPVYVYSQLVRAEALARKAGAYLGVQSNQSYRWKAEAYKFTHRLFNSTEVSPFDRLGGLYQLLTMEMALGEPGLQALHVQAMKDYLKALGGPSHISKNVKRQASCCLEVDWFLCVEVCMYATIPIRPRTILELESCVSNFTSALTGVKNWTTQVAFDLSGYDHITFDAKRPEAVPYTELPNYHNSPGLQTLRSYLFQLTDTLKERSAEISHYTLSSCLNSLLQLCLMQSMYGYTVDQSLRLTECLGAMIEESTTEIPTGSTSLREDKDTLRTELQIFPVRRRFGLACNVVPMILGYIRNAMHFPRTDQIQVDYFRACADAIRILPFLSIGSRSRIAMQLLMCGLVAANWEFGAEAGRQNRDVVFGFNDDELEELGNEIRSNWLK